MTRGILFFVDGPQPLSLLVVAAHSLRQHYPGNIGVSYGPNTPDWFITQLESEDLYLTKIPKLWEKNNWRRCHYVNHVWNTKPEVHRQSPFDVTVLYDCDHVFVDTWDDSLFDCVERYRLLSCHREFPASHRRTMQTHTIRRIFGLGRARYPDHIPVNGGCVGSTKTNLLDIWEDAINQIWMASYLSRSPDEHALSYVMQRYRIPVHDRKWSHTIRTHHEVVSDVLAIHMARSRWTAREEFHAAYCAAWNDDFLGLRQYERHYRETNPDMPRLERDKA